MKFLAHTEPNAYSFELSQSSKISPGTHFYPIPYFSWWLSFAYD